MPRLEDHNKFEKVTRLLKDLSKVNAPSNFDNELSKRIRQSEQSKKKEPWFDKIFTPELIPTAALAVTAVIILFLLKGNTTEAEDPFSIIPKLREDKTIEKELLGNVSGKISTDKTNNQSNPVKSNQKDSNISKASALGNESIERISIKVSNYLPDQAVTRSGGLNYKIIRLDGKERKTIEMLREKINSTTEY